MYNGVVVTARMSDENANLVLNAKYENRYSDDNNVFIVIPYVNDETDSQDGLAVSTDDIAAVKVTNLSTF